MHKPTLPVAPPQHVKPDRPLPKEIVSPRTPLKRLSAKKKTDIIIRDGDNEPVKETASAPAIPQHNSPRSRNHQSYGDIINQISFQSQNLKRTHSPQVPEPGDSHKVSFRMDPTPIINRPVPPVPLPKLASLPNQQLPTVTDNDPEKTIIAELQRKLSQTEAQLEEAREQVRKYSDRDPKKLQDLKERVAELAALVSALRQNLNLQSEPIIVTEGFIKLKRSDAEEYITYWACLEYPMLKLFHNETDKNVVNTISLTHVKELLKDIKNPAAFSVHTHSAVLFIQTTSPEEASSWLHSLSLSTRVRVGLEKKKKAARSGARHNKRISRKGESHNSLPAHLHTWKSHYASECTNFDDIRSLFSSHVQVIKGDDGRYKMKAGTLQDIALWCLLHCTKEEQRNFDADALFLCYNWVSTPSKFEAMLESMWTSLTRGGNSALPAGLTLTQLETRLANFACQWIGVPVVIQNHKEESAARFQFREFVMKIHRTVSLQTAQIPLHRHTRTQDAERSDFSGAADMILESAASFPVESIAQQLTVDEAELFQQIHISELMDQNWDNEELAPAVSKLVIRYNKVSNWVAFSILDTSDQKDQVEMYKKFIKIAHMLHNLKNYNSCTAILGGLSDASIIRLKNISQNLNDKYSLKLANLKDTYSPLNGYKLYRSLPTEPACLPALAVYLRDLTLMLDGNPKYDDETAGVVNFERFALVSGRIFELQRLTADLSLYFLFPVDTSLRRHLSTIDPPDSDTLYEMSLKLEPPRSKRSIEEELEALRLENQQLKAEIMKFKDENKKRLIAQQTVLLQIQNSNSKASTTVRALLDSISEGTSNPSEQAILLKLQLQAALDLVIAMSEKEESLKNSKSKK